VLPPHALGGRRRGPGVLVRTPLHPGLGAGTATISAGINFAPDAGGGSGGSLLVDNVVFEAR
jgi:hypothetical protein